MFVVYPVPVMIQPETVNRFPHTQVSSASRDVTLGAVVMHVLHGRPGETESEIHDRVTPWLNVQSQDNRCMHQNDPKAFKLNQPPVRWIERFHERRRWPVEVPILLIGRERKKQKHDIAQYDDDPITAGQDAIQDQPAPKPMIAFEI